MVGRHVLGANQLFQLIQDAAASKPGWNARLVQKLQPCAAPDTLGTLACTPPTPLPH